MFLIYSVKVVIFFLFTKSFFNYFLAKQLVFRLFNFYKKREREAPLSWYTPRIFAWFISFTV